jgi:pyridoxal phosphate enzyme (YggS family)
MKTITQKLKKLQASLPQNKKIKLVVVTKTRASKEIEEAISAGAVSIGENKVQEAEKKFPNINNLKNVEKRLIGNLQSNKTNKAVKLFDVIDTVDTEKIAKKISNAAKKINKIQRVLVQINSSGEKAKSGFLLGEKDKIQRCAENKNIKIEGLMTMGPNTKNKKEIEKAFKKTKELFDSLNKSEFLEMKTLSMGMSGDYQIAIQQGSTDIRLGTAIFGERPKIV